MGSSIFNFLGLSIHLQTCRPHSSGEAGPYGVGYPKGEEDGRFGVARSQGVEVLGMGEPGETLGSPLIPLAIWACIEAELIVCFV
jgi:hypothetical protein